MINWTRTATILPGRAKQALDYAGRVTPLVTSITGLKIRLFASASGMPTGTLTWGTDLKSFEEGLDAGAALMTDDRYLTAIAEGAELFEPGTRDHHRQLVHAAGPTEGPLGLVVATTVTPAPGKIAKAMAWGGEMTEYAANLTGLSIGFYTEAYGTFGQLTWLTGYPDNATVDKARGKMMADPGYLERIDQGGADGLWVAGSGHQSLHVRVF